MTIRQKKKRVEKGAPMPLFDRLIDETPHIRNELVAKNFLREEELQHSIGRELSNILDTRIGSDVDWPEDSDHDAVFLPEQFGLRDYAGLFAQSDSGKREIASHVRAAILRFEPRLKNPRVQITEALAEKFDVTISITGDILIDNVRKKVQFPMILHNIMTRT